MTMTVAATFPTLARREMSNYLRHPLFWLGCLLMGIPFYSNFSGWNDASGKAAGSPGWVIVPAAALGVFGLLVMYGLTRRSDRAAEAAGVAAVGQSTRTLALAAAIAVPLAVALLWWATAIYAWYAFPPYGPHEPLSDADVFAIMFGLGVIASVGGPLLGLLLARWLPYRGVAPLSAVLVVAVTIVLQGLIEATWGWKHVWVWTYWVGQSTEGEGTWFLIAGSVVLWDLYLVALCVIGLLVGLYRDPESNRGRLRMAIGASAGVAVVLALLVPRFGPLDHSVIHHFRFRG
jgi:hypothetical protein